MSEQSRPGRPAPGEKPGYLERRREKIRAEIQRNRRGDHTVPTWVMALALVLMVGAWVWLVVSS